MRNMEESIRQREDSPICLIHFSHPFVYIKSPEELLVSDPSSEEEEDVAAGGRGSHISPSALLPFERALEGPSHDLLTQLLFPELNEIEAKGNFNTVLAMLKDAWNRSRPSSGSQLAPQRQQKVTTSRRQSSAPETRIRRYTVHTTTTTFETTNPSSGSRSAPPNLTNKQAMCTDSITTTPADRSSSDMLNNCYCHTYAQNEFKFSCKLNFEERNVTHYNCNYLNSYNILPEYYPRLIPRYSSLPRSLSMLANYSSPSTSTSSVSSDDENQSLADSLEDISQHSRLPYDDKPVRGAPPLLPHRPAPRIPVPRSEKFFVPISDRETNEMLLLPPMLREKLERRRLQLENRPKITNNNNVLMAQKSPRPVRSKRLLGTKFQRFECIPEENESRKGRLTRSYGLRERSLTANRGLQAIMRDPHEVKVGLQQHQVVEPTALQEVIPSSAVLPRGREAMGEDLVAVTTGWVNFYMLRGEETTTAAGSDSGSSTADGRGRRSKRYNTWTRGQTTTRGATAVTAAVSVSERSSTVRVQQRVAPRPIVFASAVRRRRAESEPEMGRETRDKPTLPHLPHSGDGVRIPARERPAILPSLNRRNVPIIRVRQPTSTTVEDDSDTGGVSLPALPTATSTSSSESPRPQRKQEVSKSSRGARQKVARVQHKQQQQIVKSAIVAESAAAPPGMWSVTVSGVCPQPEMEVRLVFPPTADTAGTQAIAAPAPTPAALTAVPENTEVLQASPDKTSHFTLKFKNQNQETQTQQRTPTPPSPRGRGSRGGNTSRSTSNSPVTSPRRRGSLRALPSPPRQSGPPALRDDMAPAILRGGGEPVSLRGGNDLSQFAEEDPVAPEVKDPTALDALMWPEMQALLEEQLLSYKKHTRVQSTTTMTTTTTSSSAATVVERLRGGEGTDLQNQQQTLAVRGAAITTRRKKRGASIS